MNIYFSGIGGTGVGPLAMLAYDAGHKISGSDREKSLIFNDLVQLGVHLSTDQTGDFLRKVNKEQKIDFFVYTSALPDNHPELLVAKKSGITIMKRDGLLNQLIKQNNLKLIAISGTHGKTTTTGMFIWVMKELGVPVSYSIGTRLSFGPAAKYENGSEYFIYEADEFDRNMLKFRPYISVITSVDFDHSDTYPNAEAYNRAFQKFASQSESVITWNDSRLSGDNITMLDNISGPITLTGKHNKSNATLVLETLKRILPDIDETKIISAINTFPGTERRFEKLSTRLYSDYAHHPTEIASTIELAREINDNVVIVYQPHQNIRQHQLLGSGGYNNCFAGARKVYWLPTYLSREDNKLLILTPEELTKNMSQKDIVIVSKMSDKLARNIKNDLAAGALVIAMSAGDLDAWVRKLADNI